MALARLMDLKRPSPLVLGPLQPSADSFLNDRTLELGKHAHHLKQGLAGRCSRVEPLLMPEQVDTQCMQLGQEPNPPLAVPE